MEKKMGKALKYGDNINTDIISPPQYMELSVAEASAYSMQAVDPDFAGRVEKGDFFVAENNLGSGSSRETDVYKRQLYARPRVVRGCGGCRLRCHLSESRRPGDRGMCELLQPLRNL